MYEAHPNDWLVPYDGSFDIGRAPTIPKDPPSKKDANRALKASQKQLNDLQEVMYAQDVHSLLLVFQAMDASGKDSTIRAVMSGVNPAGCQVHAFKQPSAEELDHDFLWRTAKSLPERGRIGIFNRSYYEEVLVVRVHPAYLKNQNLPREPSAQLWEDRFTSIRDHEAHLARSGTLVLKFFLNVSLEEQKKRFLDRIEEVSKNWKFSRFDLAERKLWPAYMEAYQAALNATSRPWAPWYAIPADDKPAMRAIVASTIVDNLKRLDLRYPKLEAAEKARLSECRELLLNE